ncbi:MAG: glycosyltransferase family 1 protein, partial [Duncaniella sp.]|nr:glycosyltransferase family 1 protein [Duncaniella sp.]
YLAYFAGGGIPVLEGSTARVPVIAATGSCLEEAGGKGAVYCDPFDAAGVAEAMHSLLTSPERRGELVAEGEKHIAAFTDEVLGANIRAFYEKLLRGA